MTNMVGVSGEAFCREEQGNAARAALTLFRYGSENNLGQILGR